MIALKVCFVLLASAIALIDAQSPMFQVHPGQVPNIVSLRTGGRHYCSGSIFGDRWILSAGRCLQGRRPNEIIAVVGASTPRNGHPYVIDRVHVHPNINDRSANFDIGIVRTARMIQFNRYVRPAPSIAYKPYPENQRLFIVGWGHSENVAGRRLPTARGFDQLQARLLGNISLMTCRSMHSGLIPLLQAHTICALEKTGHAGTCAGDTGSPLMSGKMLIGLQLWRNDCTGRTPSIYVAVRVHLRWIIEVRRQP